MKKIVLIGQAPSRTGSPRRPLSGLLGSKIARLCGLSDDAYRMRFERINVLNRYPGKNGKGDAFPMKTAKRRAETLKKRFAGRTVVVLGSNVAGAFGLKIEPLRWIAFNGGRAAVLPHPSGINRWYNSADNRGDAAKFMRSASRVGDKYQQTQILDATGKTMR